MSKHLLILAEAINQDAETAEVAQQEAMVKAKDATAASQASLDTAYKAASELVELFAGLLGKNHNLVLEIRKMRK